jgi:hypothetical protein
VSLDVQDTVHEVRELVEARPRLVGLVDRHRDVVHRWIGSRRVFFVPPSSAT